MSQSIESPEHSNHATASASMPQNAPRCPTGENAPRADHDVLSPKQWLALELLAAGKRLTQAARDCGVDRKTLYRWRHEDADFIAELRARRRELYEGAADRLAALLPRAVKVLALQLSDPGDRLSLQAATAILRVANIKELLAADNDDDDDGPGDRPPRK